MNRFMMVLLAGVILSMIPGGARADDVQSDKNLQQYLKQLQVKLDHAAWRAGQAGTKSIDTAPQSLSQKLYWKGRKTGTVSLDEVRVFHSAVEQAQAGKNAAAITTLQRFQQKYPKSVLAPDAKETMARLQAIAPPAVGGTVVSSSSGTAVPISTAPAALSH